MQNVRATINIHTNNTREIMEKIDYIFMQAVKESFDLKGIYVELGSRVITNQKHLSARNVFKGDFHKSEEYIGVDYMEGEGVDTICDVRNLTFENDSINTIIAMNLFEHVEESWLAFEEIKRVLSKKGIVIIATPFSYDIHGCPEDYYRYTPSLYLNVFKDLKTKITVTVGYKMRPKMVYFIGGNADTLEKDFDKFTSVYSKKYQAQLKPFAQQLSSIRSMVSPSHFKKDIKYQHTFEITLSGSTDNML